MSTEAAVQIEIIDSIAILRLNRPEKLNAMNGAQAAALGNALESANTNPAINVIIITGNGRAFCAGADLKAVSEKEALFSTENPEWGFGGIVRHWISKPVIAAVNGIAYGGGFEVALSCDLIIADPEAKFALPEVTRGLVAVAGGIIRAPHRIPFSIAAELAFTGAPISAQRAESLGLVNHISEPGESLAKAIEIAKVIAANAPLAVEASKALLHKGHPESDLWKSAGWQANEDVRTNLFSTNDAKEGALAFVEKRKPQWKRN